jgi:hypothetical protein
MLAELHVVVTGADGARVIVAVDNWQLPRGEEEAPMTVAELHGRVRKTVGGMDVALLNHGCCVDVAWMLHAFVHRGVNAVWMLHG